MCDASLDSLGAALGTFAERDVSLRSFTTFRIGGPADLLVRAHTIADLERVRKALATVAGEAPDVLVIGQGSNLLVSDDGFRGLVVLLGGDFEAISIDVSNTPEQMPHSIVAGGAVKLPVLARRSVAAGLTGLEWMVGVPGSVGGAVRMNAGGHGSDIAAALQSATLFTATGDGGLRCIAASDLGFGYRRSNVHGSDIVVDATFALSSGDRVAGERELAEIVRWRREHQPGGANCGSVFTNPPGDSAGRLIDVAGLKGFRIGTAHVSEKHANFIQADESGSAADVWSLILEIRRRVAETFGVLLHPEVRTAGFPAELDPPKTESPTSDFPPQGAST